MLRIKEVIIEDVPLIFHSLDDPPLTLDEFPTSCGAGYIGDLLVPDEPWDVSFSPACWSHDSMWEVAETFDDFILSNRIFKQNMMSLIDNLGGKRFDKEIAELYYLSVSGPWGLLAYCGTVGVGRDVYELWNDLRIERDA